MSKRADSVLKANRWRCIICDVEITDTASTQREKVDVLNKHLDTHVGNSNYDKDMKAEWKPGYFNPITEKLQDNVKN